MKYPISKINLAHCLMDNLLAAGKRTTVTFLNKGEADRAVSLSGDELHDIALRKSSLILEHTDLGSARERPVILAMAAGLDFITTLFSCVYAGLTTVVVPVSKNRISLERLKGIVEDCGAIDILTDSVGTSAFESLISLSGNMGLNVVHVPQYDDITHPAPELSVLSGFAKKNTENAFIQYTSGSSKKPKGVVLSDKNIQHNSTLVGQLWGFNTDTVMGSWLPHYHDMGLMGGIFYSILNGGSLVFMSPMAFVQKPIRWLQLISSFGVTISGAPPFAFELCTNQSQGEEFRQLDLSSWKAAYCGAETVFRKVLEDFREAFKPAGLDPSAVFACYGMAEITLYAGGQPSHYSKGRHPDENPLVEPCYLSETLVGGIKMVDPETGVLLDDGQKGEIWLQSDSLGRGYLVGSAGLPLEYNRAEFQNTHDELTGRWFRTGDLGVKMNNRLYVHGRIKDTIIVNGLNVSAADIEWYAGEVHPELNGLGAAAFTSRSDQEGRAHLLIESKRSRMNNIDLKEVETTIRSRIKFHFSVELDDVLILKRGILDRTSSGKVRRLQIASKYDRSGYEASILNKSNN